MSELKKEIPVVVNKWTFKKIWFSDAFNWTRILIALRLSIGFAENSKIWFKYSPLVVHSNLPFDSTIRWISMTCQNLLLWITAVNQYLAIGTDKISTIVLVGGPAVSMRVCTKLSTQMPRHSWRVTKKLFYIKPNLLISKVGWLQGCHWTNLAHQMTWLIPDIFTKL